MKIHLLSKIYPMVKPMWLYLNLFTNETVEKVTSISQKRKQNDNSAVSLDFAFLDLYLFKIDLIRDISFCQNIEWVK